MSALVLEQVVVCAAGQPLFAPLDLRVEPGVVASVTGASGSGKSSLLAYLCGVLPQGLRGDGRVRIGADDLTCAVPQARRLGLLFQDALLFPHLSVAGNVLFGLRAGGTRAERLGQVEEALDAVGLGGFAGRDPATLSGGQKARVALLRVMLAEPRALLLDEPFGALDQANRERVREQLFAEARRRALPTLLVTHEESDVVAAGGPVVTLTAP